MPAPALRRLLFPGFCILAFLLAGPAPAQLLSLPDGGVNLHSVAGRRVCVTDIGITWNAPGVKGREGKIWGTPVAPWGFEPLGFGSDMPSPWRAGANECTTISFSTDVTINGMALSAGTYAFFVALYPDSCTLIFNRNIREWGAYFYDPSLDVLRVKTVQEKDRSDMVERLVYTFGNQTPASLEVALEWERWRIPFTVAVDADKTTLASIQSQMSGAMGFDPPSLQAAAAWCLQHQVNEEEALHWINSAVNPGLGGVRTFTTLSTKAGLLDRLGRKAEGEQAMTEALAVATPVELHVYGRRLLAQGKTKEAMDIFEMNFKRNKGAWPTHVGLMRGYSATGDLKRALAEAKLALAQAPDEGNRKALEQAISQLTEGKPL